MNLTWKGTFLVQIKLVHSISLVAYALLHFFGNLLYKKKNTFMYLENVVDNVMWASNRHSDTNKQKFKIYINKKD